MPLQRFPEKFQRYLRVAPLCDKAFEDFSLVSDGNQYNKYYIQSVTVKKLGN